MAPVTDVDPQEHVLVTGNGNPDLNRRREIARQALALAAPRWAADPDPSLPSSQRPLPADGRPEADTLLRHAVHDGATPSDLLDAYDELLRQLNPPEPGPP